MIVRDLIRYIESFTTIRVMMPFSERILYLGLSQDLTDQDILDSKIKMIRARDNVLIIYC